MNFERSSGILLHPTSLPGEYGIGSLGKSAFDFIDFLIAAGQKIWQILPLGPTGFGDSPYQCFSAFAGNPLLIDIPLLVQDGLLSREEATIPEKFDINKVEFGPVIKRKNSLYRQAFSNFKSSDFSLLNLKFQRFCKNHGPLWLDDYALFISIKDHFNGKGWNNWDEDIKRRENSALERYKNQLKYQIEYNKFLQFLFFQQWSDIKHYANVNGIKIIGDIPIFIAFDSADAWANPELFQFDANLNLIKVAGVPPDYFSKYGQLWGNPLYRWDKLRENGFIWWINRIKEATNLVDIIRIDHFRGFCASWAVPAGEKTAVNGKWETVPGDELFKAIKDALGNVPIIAEDLGLITPDVEKLRADCGFPGMKILQFAFDPHNPSPYAPHNIEKNSVVYTGTHDNETTLGWYEKLGHEYKEYLREYLNITDNHINRAMIRAAWASPSVLAIVPMQDILSLGNEARMNEPGAKSGNWQWRFTRDAYSQELADALAYFTRIYWR